MKKVFYIFLSALTLVFAACNKQELAPAEDSSQEGQLTTVTIKASNGDADTKAAISNSLKFTWTAGDQIAIHTDNGSGTYYTSSGLVSGGSSSADFTVDLAGNRNGFAVYPASVANTWDGTDLTLTLPNTYTLAQVSGDESPLPMIAEDGGSSLSFKHVAGLLRLTISNIPTGTNKIKLDFNGKKVSGDFTISTPSAGSSSIASVAGTKGTNDIIWITGTPSTDPVTVNIPLPTGATYSDLIVSAWNGNVALRGQVVAFNTYTPVRARGKKLSAALNLGAVSIASGKYAVFAPGNLQGTYDGTSWTWDFAAHQYDYIGDGGEETVGNEKITLSSPWMSGSGTVDLFSWIGASGRTDEDVTLQGVAEYGIISGWFNPNTFGNINEPIKHDWGELSIAEYASNTWRTPVGGDSGEWAYMLSTRAGNKFAKAYLMGTTHGVIIFPDNYVHPDGLAEVQGMNNTGSTSWNLNTFTEEEWIQMETAGAVFLPLAGSRTYKRQIIFTFGLYWSATGIAPVGSETLQARALMFNANYLVPNDNLTRTNGQAVRLVRDLN